MIFLKMIFRKIIFRKTHGIQENLAERKHRIAMPSVPPTSLNKMGIYFARFLKYSQ